MAVASGIHQFEACGGFVQIGIPASSSTGYSMRGCWGFTPPFGLGLPNYPSQIPFQRRYGGYRFSRRRFPSSRQDIPFPATEIPFPPNGAFPPPDRTFPLHPTGHPPPTEHSLSPNKHILPSQQTFFSPKEQLPLQTLNFCREERIELQSPFYLLVYKAAKFCNLLSRAVVLTSERLGKFQALLG